MTSVEWGGEREDDVNVVENAWSSAASTFSSVSDSTGCGDGVSKGSLLLTVAERANTLAFLGKVHQLEVDRLRPRDGLGGVVRNGLGQRLGDHRRVHDAVLTVLDSCRSGVLSGFERPFTRVVREHIPEE